jgi:cytoplasmic tRNA 2-thiolation protein 1
MIPSRFVFSSFINRLGLTAEQTVKRNQQQYDLPLKILSYDELYGWTMDKIVEQVGRKNNCDCLFLSFAYSGLMSFGLGTFCGVFRRQALDRGAAQLGVDHIVTGHNADDIAETVLMNSCVRSLTLAFFSN